jgi:N-acetylglutamate synthase-like GNAT family acetyltransferase
MSGVAAVPLRLLRSPAPVGTRRRLIRPRRRRITIRTATAAEAGAIHELIADHVAEGHLLPRGRDEVALHAQRFVVALDGRRVVACADLAPLSRTVAEVRSLVVSSAARSNGIGRRLIDDLVGRAAAAGFVRLCAFTHSPAYFVAMGFSIVPHAWLPEKIEVDCRSCGEFRRCGQYAVMLPLAQARQSCVPLASLHG